LSKTLDNRKASGITQRPKYAIERQGLVRHVPNYRETSILRSSAK
jgi:hypothetical protein